MRKGGGGGEEREAGRGEAGRQAGRQARLCYMYCLLFRRAVFLRDVARLAAKRQTSRREEEDDTEIDNERSEKNI